METAIDWGTDIYGRNLELFFPLLITASLFHESIFEEILKIAVKLNSVKREDEFAESKDISLIEFISTCDRLRFEPIFIHDLLRQFKEFVGVHSEEEDKWINNNWLGLAIKRLQLIANRKRVTKGVLVWLNVDKAKSRINMFRTNEVKE